MPTQTKENYLKAIYYLQQRNKTATISELAEEMQVNKSTVTEMIKKLADRGWVDYQKYKPIRLSELGQVEAAQIIRKHRLTEMFLVDIMGFGWEEVHEIAEEVEHLKSESLFDRMDRLLGFPDADPHGSPIPAKNGELYRRPYKALSNYRVGDTLRLKAVIDNTDSLLAMLTDKQIGLGTEFNIKKVEPFDKSMVVDYRNCEGITLTHEVCRRLMVEQIN
ncbi:metal-dependent transcriptional regulator [Portibacter marinus]|uniref:metal-dependent transcriptional regulator n=1 Tax=Portibacter marinus TaxID=2898660 RepID=UPI001F30E52D|nr:metal-dependent transcriptional regulator [Portibacter marinus]